MVAATAEKSHPLWMKRLETPAYRVTDAARYAGLRPAAISEWFRRSGPSLPHRDRGLPLSYLELIEVAFVATFKSLNVPMRDIRRVRDCLARVLESEYPFSTRDFKSKGLHSILRESSGQLNAVDLRRIVVFEASQICCMEFHSEKQVFAVRLRLWNGRQMASCRPTFAGGY